MKRCTIIYIFICYFTLLPAIDYIAITEIMYDTPYEESLSNRIEFEGEFIELYNLHNKPADVSGWSVEIIESRQTCQFPKGTIIAPHSTLIIAFYDTETPWDTIIISEYNTFKEHFRWLYNINDMGGFTFLCQDSLILPNSNTTLILKDSIGQTRDSVRYGYTDSQLRASNDITNNNAGFMEHIYSLQRREITFNKDGCAHFYYQEWLSWNKGSYSSKQVNSVGTLTEDFLGCNIIPISDKDKIDSCNFILETTPRLGFTSIDSTLHDPNKTIRKRTYYDPMYRPTVTMQLNQTPQKNHLATFIEYDAYGRLYREWLQIPIEWEHLTNNTFKNNATQYYHGESRPFVEHTYSTATWENGVAKNELVGIQKVGDDMGRHKVSFYSRGNDSAEVRLFQVTLTGLLECKGFYRDSMLCVTQTTDEDNKTKAVYTNQRNQVVMEKVGDAATYYVYNDLNQLCYVLPPLAINQLEEGVYDEDNDGLKKYAYIYKYDERGNQIYKRLPGCEPIVMEYDKRNLLVASQTGNQRNRGDCWIQYTYDKLCRLTRMTEINKSDGILIDTLQAGEVIGARSSTYNLIDGNNIQNVLYSSQLLITKNYDNYLHVQLLSDQIKSHMSFQAFEGNATYTTNAKGLLTGTRTYYLDGSGNYSETVYYYDYRGREIQRRSTNHLGGYDVLSTKYDFVNNITDTWSSQSTNNGLTTTEHYHYTYDHANRLLTTTYTFNNESPIVLQSYHYDELGRVRSRHIHNGIDSMAFNYDIRNQVTQIKSSGYEQKYYYNQSCPIAPDFSGGLYNGNISATTWTYGNQTNGYVYRYDNMNRLASNYSILNSSLNVDYLYSESFSYDAQGNVTNLTRWDNNDLMNYLQLTYDGNQLLNVDDNGFGSYEYATKQYHDNNTEGNDFAYDANGNMIYDQDRNIAAIRYNLLNLPDTIQFMNGNLIIHRYDATGKRLETKYLTKKIATTVPLGNVLSTPKRPEIFYITRDAFHNNVVYTANNNDPYGIEFVHNPEGYIRYYGPEEHYHFYYIKDLLDNIRETYVHPEAGYKECIQRMQYYPSGLPWAETAGASEQPWKYNGKEFVEMHGLDEYDSKARWYYPAICRTTTMDPLAEKYYPTSPYAWCGNNTMRFVDPDGRDIYMFDQEGNFTGDIIEQEGEHMGRMYFSENDNIDFSFNDPADAERLCLEYSDSHWLFSGDVDQDAITSVVLINSNDISSLLPKMNNESQNILRALIYASKQSREGSLDFVSQSHHFIQKNPNALFLPMDGKNIVYNNFDFGNYLWGKSMNILNIPLNISILGAHIDNMIHHWGQLDSSTDQRAINNGYKSNF